MNLKLKLVFDLGKVVFDDGLWQVKAGDGPSEVERGKLLCILGIHMRKSILTLQH